MECQPSCRQNCIQSATCQTPDLTEKQPIDNFLEATSPTHICASNNIISPPSQCHFFCQRACLQSPISAYSKKPILTNYLVPSGNIGVPPTFEIYHPTPTNLLSSQLQPVITSCECASDEEFCPCFNSPNSCLDTCVNNCELTCSLSKYPECKNFCQKNCQKNCKNNINFDNKSLLSYNSLKDQLDNNQTNILQKFPNTNDNSHKFFSANDAG